MLAHVLLKCSDDDVRNEIVTEEIEFAINNNNKADEIKVRDVPWATKYEDGMKLAFLHPLVNTCVQYLVAFAKSYRYELKMIAIYREC